ncbi:MAG TPA: creatininase family protein [Candidatus Nitrosotenuis sp.]|jgi:creatinine amidohydrolase|nr:creatininase family protein [Candidatus Nitrosotenuis sp.]
MRLYKLEELSWGDLRRLGHEGALFLLPISPLEDHGPHLPSGTDLILAQGFTGEVARRILELDPKCRLVVAPGLPLGASLLQSLGCLRLRPSTLKKAITELGRQLEREGVRRAALVNVHFAASHVAALEAACRLASRGRRLQMISPTGRLTTRLLSGRLTPALERALGRPLTEVERTGLLHDYHGGSIETSLMLKFRPDLVAFWYRDLPPHVLPPGELLRTRGRKLRTHRGYFGSPAVASPELAEALCRVLVEESARTLLSWMGGQTPSAALESGLHRAPLHWDLSAPLAALLGLALGMGAATLALAALRRGEERS